MGYAWQVVQVVGCSAGIVANVDTIENTTPYTLSWSHIGTGHWKCIISGYDGTHNLNVLVSADQGSGCEKVTYDSEDLNDWLDVFTYDNANTLTDTATFSIQIKEAVH